MANVEREAAIGRMVRAFAPLFVRAIRACRLYPAGSPVRQSNLEGARAALSDLLLAVSGPITLGVREGTLVRGDEVVFIDEDARSGPTHLLASHAIFELTFQPGITPGELERLVRVLAEDRDHRRRRGEDMVTLLWRHHFTHARYRHVDVLAMAIPADTPEERLRFEDEETARLRGELADVVRALAIDEAAGEDVITLNDQSLGTPEACQLAISGNQQRIDWAVAAFAHRTPPRVLEALAPEVHASRAHEALLVRMASAVFDGLLRHPQPTEAGSGIAVVWVMLTDLLAQGALDGVRYLVERARAVEARPAREQDVALAAALIERLMAREVIDRAVDLLDRGTDPRDASRAAALLRAIGARALDGLLARLDGLERPQAREVVCALAIEASVAGFDAVTAAVAGARAEAAAQLLRAALAAPPEDQARVAVAGLAHGLATVRAIAVRMIAGFEGATPAALVVRALGDSDTHVRAAAARAVSQQRIETGARTIAAMLQRPGALERDPVELRALFHAHATLSGRAAVDELSRLLSEAAAITGGHKTSSIEAAAHALAATGSPVATEVLARGARSLNPRLRGPCKAALGDPPRTSAPPEEPRVARAPWPDALEFDAPAMRRLGGHGLRPSAAPPRPSSLPSAPRGSVPPPPGRSSAPPGTPPVPRTSMPPGPPSAPPTPRTSMLPASDPRRATLPPPHSKRVSLIPRPAVTIDESLKDFLHDEEGAS